MLIGWMSLKTVWWVLMTIQWSNDHPMVLKVS